MSRHSTHVTVARTVTPSGAFVDLSDLDIELDFDETQSPYGEATVECALIEDQTKLDKTDPHTQRGLRMFIEAHEFVGDPVTVREMTVTYTGDVSDITAAKSVGGIQPAEFTADYFVGWNAADARPGSDIMANLFVTAREIDHAGQRIRFKAQTDEALTLAYALISRSTETSGSLSVRDTVNYALAKVGAALTPSAVDAPVVEADAIIWEPGTTAWDYMSNVAEAAGLVVRCDEERMWTLTDREAVRDDGAVFDAKTAATEVVDLTDDKWADAVVVRYDWTDATTGDSKTAYDTASAVSDPIKVLTVNRTVPYPGTGAAAYWLRRFRPRGRVYDIESVNDYALRPGMAFTADMPYTPTQTGFIESVRWTLPANTCTVHTRGAADTRPGMIDLYPDGVFIDDLVGFINDQNPGV